MDKLHKNLGTIREKHYQLNKQHNYEEWLQYYEADLVVLYEIFSNYYIIPYNKFVQLIYDTQ